MDYINFKITFLGIISDSQSGTMVEVESDLGTMVINSDGEEEDVEDSTMKSMLLS